MRKIVLSLTSVVALALAGCNAPSSAEPGNSGSPASSSTTAVAPGNEVSGTIALRDPAQLSARATLSINLVDVSSEAAGSAPLASKTSPAGSFPQPFQLTFAPNQVKPNDLYVVQVSLVDGERHYSMPIQAPVLTKGNPTTVSIVMVAEQTPGEKVLVAFDAEAKQIGGMKVSHGTKLEPNASRGWQLFREGGKAAFIRELVDYGDKGFTSTDYAYKDGKPWAVVQQTKASSSAKASAIDRAGWDDSGALVLRQHQVGDEVQPLDVEAASKLQKQALDILSIATNGKNK